MTSPVDWSGVLLALRSMGYTTASVASVIDIPRSTLMGWIDGAEPRHCDGERLIAMWSEATQLPREALPQRTSKCRDYDTCIVGYSNG